MAKKHCRKFQPAEYCARMLQTDRRPTDGRAIAYSEREFTFAKKPCDHVPLVLTCKEVADVATAVAVSVVAAAPVSTSVVLMSSVDTLAESNATTVMLDRSANVAGVTVAATTGTEVAATVGSLSTATIGSAVAAALQSTQYHTINSC